MVTTCVIVVRAKRQRKRVPLLTKIVLITLYLLPIWDLLPAYAIYKHKCVTEGGIRITDVRAVPNVFMAPNNRMTLCTDCLRALVWHRLQFAETKVPMRSSTPMAPSGRYVQYSISHETDPRCASFYRSKFEASTWREMGLDIKNKECIALTIVESRTSDFIATKIYNQPVSRWFAVKRTALELRSAANNETLASLTYFYYVAGIFRFFGLVSDDAPTFQCPPIPMRRGGNRNMLVGQFGLTDLMTAMQSKE